LEKMEKQQVQIRLTKHELEFLTEALKTRKEWLRQLEAEMEKQKLKVADIKMNLHTGHSVEQCNKLQEAQMRLAEMRRKINSEHFVGQGFVIDVLIRRFEAAVKGKMKHSGNRTDQYLQIRHNDKAKVNLKKTT